MSFDLRRGFDHLILLAGCVFMMGPLVYLVVELSQNARAAQALHDLIFAPKVLGFQVSLWQMLSTSFVVAMGIAAVTTVLSLLAAFALVFFAVPGREYVFGAMVLAMFFPIETRILPSFAIAHQLGLLNSYAGLVLPVAASGFGVLVFRQFLKQVPKELIEAARLDGARPLRCLWDILLPMSAPMVAALFAIFFVIGWNQYVWPLMLSTTSAEMVTVVRGVARAGVSSAEGQALALLAMLPPGLVMIVAQRWLVRGLTVGMH